MANSTRKNKIKILFVHTYYQGFIDDFYLENNNAEQLTYDQLKSKIFNTLFASSNFYSTYLRKYGWQGEETIINDPILQGKWSMEHHLSVNFKEPKLLSRLPVKIRTLLKMRGWIKQVLFAQIKYFKPTVVYFHDLWVMNSEDLEYLKSTLGIKLVVGQIASPIPNDKQALEKYDLIITSLPNFIKTFTQMGVKTEYLKWCAYGKLPKLIKSQKRIYDTVFAGSFTHLHTKGDKMLNYLSRHTKLDLWGFGQPHLPHYHGLAYGKNLYKILAQSKIAINRHIDLSENYANNMRMYEATIMGGLLITDQKENMNEFFKVGKEVINYTSHQDLLKKIKYFLDHPQELNRIAKAGQKRTLKNHTYEIRMQELNSILRKYL
jgi:hypothetical protein